MSKAVNKKVLLCLAVFSVTCALISGCAGTIKDEKSRNYQVKYNDTLIAVNSDTHVIIENLGEPVSIFEAPLCASDGINRQYTYPHINISAYVIGGEERIFSVVFTDDLISTEEGISIGDSENDVISIYGAPIESEGELHYEGAGMLLEFIIHDGVVEGIRYVSTIIEI